MTVNIAAQWKKDTRDLNGLTEIEEELIGQPLQRHLAVVELEVVRITRDIADGGAETPTVNILHIEPVDGEQAEAVRLMLDGLYQARSGKRQEAVPRTLTELSGQQTLPLDGADADGGEPVSERTHDEWLPDTVGAKQ